MRPGRSTGRITLTGVRATGYHGVLPHERRDAQEFVVDLVLRVDVARAAARDDVADTVDYGAVAQDVVDVVVGDPVDLIETLAERIAQAVLDRHEHAQAVEVTVHKPQAPIPVPFGDVAVTTSRTRSVPVVIALGANLGDPASTLAASVRDLRRHGLRALRRSALYETDPVGGPDQPAYVNAVVTAQTSLAPGRLLDLLHRIERTHGRERSTHWGARTLDLDLIRYGIPGHPDHRVLTAETTGGLTLPHPRAHERGFVLRPWLDVDPDAVLEGARGSASVRDLWDGLTESARAGVRPGPAWPSSAHGRGQGRRGGRGSEGST